MIKNLLTSRKILFLMVFSLIINVCLIVAFIYDVPFGRFKILAFQVIRTLDFHYSGKEDFLLHYKNEGSLANNELDSYVLETGSLPLRIYEERISEKFNSGAGGLFEIRDKLFAFDYAGQIFYFNNDTTYRISKKTNNSIEKSLINKGGEIQSRRLRTHDIVFDSENSVLYKSYSRMVSNTTESLVLARSIVGDSLSFDQFDSWTIIYESHSVDSHERKSQEAGGAIALTDTSILLSLGYSDNFGNHDYEEIEKTLLEFGRIVEIDKNSLRQSTFTKGHRTVQGLAFKNDSILLGIEHGPQGGDEINYISKNKNYGWPFKSYGTDYGSWFRKLDSLALPSDLLIEEPLYAFVPSIAPSSIISIVSFHEKLKGDLLLSSLSGRSLFFVKLRNNRIISIERIWLNKRIRDIVEIGEIIYALTDDGELLQITVDSGRLTDNYRNKTAWLVENYLNKCFKCHSRSKVAGYQKAPYLGNIFNRPIAYDKNYNYSIGLSSKNEYWTANNLKKYLVDPQSFAPGTSMVGLNLTTEEIDEIVNAFKKYAQFGAE